jgi:hypothetical protein
MERLNAASILVSGLALNAARSSLNNRDSAVWGLWKRKKFLLSDYLSLL